MEIVKSGLIIESSEQDHSFNGKSGQGWSLRIVKEDNMVGYYIYYTSPKKDEGYDDWYENLELAERALSNRVERLGWRIRWDNEDKTVA